jgi:superfamily I DNA/RNA helicase
MADASEVLPLQSELFDLVIIDEATQCDISSCMPILQRARRAVVVGDPNQLRHVSFLSRQRQQTIAEQNELDPAQQDLFSYREKSILDLLSDKISTQEQVLFLDEHYRSMPRIIEFSNGEFYAGALKVMTQRPETVDLQCVRLCHVPDGHKVRGTNDPEAQALVDEVVQRVEAEAGLPEEVCHSLGVLSPFRDQVDHIFSLLQTRLSLEAVNKHNLMVGTAHTFQGEERDVMYLSLVVDREAHPASFRFLDNPNVFNVSITRARNEQYVFCSIQPEDLCGDTLVRRYLTSIIRGPKPGSVPRTGPPDVFLQEVRSELHQRGFHTWPAYPVAGLKIDLVVEQSGKTLGIDLIGYPGEFAAVFDLERYRMLQRAGLLLFPLSYHAWRQDKDACVHAIWNWHKRLHH